MNSLIKYDLYFVVVFSALAFGAAEVWAFSIVEFVVFLAVFLFIVGIGIKSGIVNSGQD